MAEVQILYTPLSLWIRVVQKPMSAMGEQKLHLWSSDLSHKPLNEKRKVLIDSTDMYGVVLMGDSSRNHLSLSYEVWTESIRDGLSYHSDLVLQVLVWTLLEVAIAVTSNTLGECVQLAKTADCKSVTIETPQVRLLLHPLRLWYTLWVVTKVNKVYMKHSLQCPLAKW